MIAALLLVVTALPLTIGAAAGPPELFGPGVEQGPDREARRSRTVTPRIDLANARGPLTVTLDLFTDRRVVMTLHRSPRHHGPAEWSGRVPGHPGAAATLVAEGGAVFGNVHLGADGEYTIRTTPEGIVIAELDPLAIGVDAVVSPTDLSDPVLLADVGDPVLDVMIVWTPEVLTQRFAGDTATGRLWAEARISELSAVLADSQVPGSARLAYAGTAEYDDTGEDVFDGLYYFTYLAGADCDGQTPGTQACDPAGELDRERAQRDLLGADIAVLVVNDPSGSISGVAWSICRAGTPPHPSVEAYCPAQYGFAVTAFASADGFWTMSHEIGHLLGGFHDAATNGSDPEYDEYNRGYRIIDLNGDTGFSTVMAYAVAGAPRVGFYSNPDLEWMGTPMGIPIGSPGEADNSAHFGVSLPLVAAFRDRQDCRGRTPTVIGTTGADNPLNGTTGADVIMGFGGADVIYGLGGDDLICAGGGADVVYGGDGKDKIYGQNGDDTLFGNEKSDRLYGGDNDDVLRGGNGTRDRLSGGGGIDDLDGGNGDDDRCTLGETYDRCEVVF